MMRRALIVAAAVVVLAVLLHTDEPCAEFNGWRWVQIWPRPDGCR